MCVSLVKAKIFAETPILKDIFIFLANGHSFQKCSFLVEILSFLKEVFSVFEKCQILMALFLFGKKYHFMQKVLVFGQRSELLCTVIKSSRAKLWGKVTSVFLNINFLCKTQFGQKCHFPSKIYITCGINSFFFEKGVNLVVSYGINDHLF